jgi:predicted ribosomally synthesized peptide with SipW-like signal peptide
MKNNRMKRSTLVTILALVLALAVAASATYAYMTDSTEKRANNFTFASGNDALDARLVEPEWDGIVDYEYDDEGNLTPVYAYIDDDANPSTPNVPVYGYNGGNPASPILDKTALGSIVVPEGKTIGDVVRPRDTDGINNPSNHEEYGDDDAVLMIPGDSALKNPIIYNTGVVLDEWVAIKATFVYADGHADAGKPLSMEDYIAVTDVIGVDWDNAIGNNNTEDRWQFISQESGGISQIYYYKNTLDKIAAGAAPGVYDQTIPLFTAVSVSPDAVPSQMLYLEQMGGFVIFLEGFAVQRDVADSYEEFRSYGTSGGVVFENSPTSTNAVSVTAPGILKKEPLAETASP